MKQTKITEKLEKAREKVEQIINKNEQDIKVERFSPTNDKGLENNQVEQRIKEGQVNSKPINRTKSIARIIFDNLFNFCNGVTIFLVILLVCIGAADYAVSSCIIFISIAIGIAQEIRAKRTVEKLSMVVDSSCDILRAGELKEKSTREIVLDDLYILKQGLQVPVDSILRSGSVEVDESILTGESIPVKKNAGDSVLAASHVISGEAMVQADRVGKDCYIENIARIARRINKPQSRIFSVLNKIIFWISCLLVPLSILLLISNRVVSGENWNQTIINVSSSAIAMIPVGMFLLTSTALAASVLKLSKKNTLAQDLYSVEMLAMVDTLLLDKTGTITDGKLEIVEEKVFSDKENIRELAGALYGATADKNATALAFIAKYPDTGSTKVNTVVPFSSIRKYAAMETDDGVFVMGAPDYVVENNDELDKFVERNALLCRRSIVLARANCPINDFDKSKTTVIAVFALEDSLRDDVKDTLKWFADNEVDIKIVSGDNPLTVSQIAIKSGVKNGERYLNCHDLSDDEIVEKSLDTAVFGRVSPEQKCTLVKSLQSQGRIVGMIGDGVNDVQALKEADCSISFACANEVARNISRIVLMDSNFKTMPKIVEEGRSVIGNIEKVASLYIMKNIFVMFFTLVFALVGFFTKSAYYPFDTKKLLLIEFFVIGVPTFAIALQPSKRRVTGDFLKNVMRNTIPSALSLIVAVSIIFVECEIRDMSFIGDAAAQNQYIASIATYALTLSGFGALLKIAMPPNVFRLSVIGVMIVVAVGGIFLDGLVLDGLFLNLDFPKGIDFLFLAIALGVAVAVNLILQKVLEKVQFREI